MLKGVITGDIVHSTQVKPEDRSELLEALQLTVNDLKAYGMEVGFEIFRGDSFQIVISDIEEVLRIAIIIRAGLIRKTSVGEKWDARLALGLGTIDFDSSYITSSDGEAFRNSGREFDTLGKNRLAIRTPWDEFNNEFEVSTAFTDALIQGWSISQADSVYNSLLFKDLNQKQLAEHLKMSPQGLNKRLSMAKIHLIELYLARYAQLIKQKK